jgi:DNA-binding MarR family transcriptional regulator
VSDDYDVPPESPYALLSQEETRAWFAYMKLQLRLRYEMNRQLQADSDISLADYDVLVALTSRRDGRMSVTALATRLGWERSRTSHHTKRLALRGLVSTSTSEQDRRVTDVTLTTEGWETLKRAAPDHIALVRTMFFDGLSPGTLLQLSETLEHVYANVIEHGTLPRPDDHP